jgi:serine protease Do
VCGCSSAAVLGWIVTAAPSYADNEAPTVSASDAPDTLTAGFRGMAVGAVSASEADDSLRAGCRAMIAGGMTTSLRQTAGYPEMAPGFLSSQRAAVGCLVMIRQTLARTKRATYCVLVQDGSEPVGRPAGTGFFLTADGLFATAAHVLDQGRPDRLFKESNGEGEGHPSIPITEVLFSDPVSDFALMRAQLDPERQAQYGAISYLQPSDRVLEEGEPIYAFGYPLSQPGPPLTFTYEQLVVLFGEEVMGRIRRWGDGPMASPPKFAPDQTLSLATHRLSPRTTSAIVASAIDYYETLPLARRNLPDHYYVLDKALNFGNSGGPIIATETGDVYALCTGIQTVMVPQPYPPGAVWIPSLYGVVTRLTLPAIRAALENHGVEFAHT